MMVMPGRGRKAKVIRIGATPSSTHPLLMPRLPEQRSVRLPKAVRLTAARRASCCRSLRISSYLSRHAERMSVLSSLAFTAFVYSKGEEEVSKDSEARGGWGEKPRTPSCPRP